MALYDEEEVRKENEKSRKTKRLVLTGIILSIIVIIALIGVIAYLIYNPNKITVSLNGSQNEKLYNILSISKEEDGTTLIYAPIRTITTFFTGYESGDGGKESNYNDKDYCYIENENELVVFKIDSDILSKENKTSNEYEDIKIENPVIRKNEELYIELEGLEKAFNLVTSFDEKSKKLSILELSKLVDNAESIAKKAGYDGISKEFVNTKAILDGMIVAEKNKLYGIITYENKSQELVNPQFTSITYNPKRKNFKVQVDGKYGIIDSEGKVVINPNYQELVLIDDVNELYLVKVSNGLYGVIDKIGDIVIYPEYNKIGVDIDNFKENGLRTGYLLFNEIIPVQKNGNWGFYKIATTTNEDGTESIQCNRITDFIFDNIGCVSKSRGSLIYNLMILEDYGLIVIGENGKYGFMDAEGKTFGVSIADIYIETSEGKNNYYMITESGNKLNVIEELEKRGYKKINK